MKREDRSGEKRQTYVAKGRVFTLSTDGGRRDGGKGGKKAERRSNSDEEWERRRGQEERVNLRTAVQTTAHFGLLL